MFLKCLVFLLLSTDFGINISSHSWRLCSHHALFLFIRKRKGKVRRNSNGLPDEMSLLSVDFPNRSEASAGSDLDSILRGTSVQQNGGLHGLPVHM